MITQRILSGIRGIHKEKHIEQDTTTNPPREFRKLDFCLVITGALLPTVRYKNVPYVRTIDNCHGYCRRYDVTVSFPLFFFFL